MTAPLTPADCDLRGLQFMPLDVMRLRDSDLALKSTGDEFKAAVLLWCASWLQVPAASLPNDEIILMKLSGSDTKTWRKVRGGALRGWEECTDGRLYHSVVAEKALEAWDRRGEWEDKQENKTTRQQRWRERCKLLSQTLRDAGVTPPAGAALAILEDMVSRLPNVDSKASTETSTVDAREMPLTGTGTGTSTSVSNETAQSASLDLDEELDPLAELRALPLAKGCWRLAVRVLSDQGNLSDTKARTFIGKLRGQGITDDELWQIAEAAWREQTEAPQPYLIKAAEGVIARRNSDDPMLRPEEWRQRRWLDEFREGRFAWDPRRGPAPGQPGCRVSAELQREFNIAPALSEVRVRGAA